MLINWIKELIKSFVEYGSYRNKLERYIVSHNPQNIYDVEKLTEEFDRTQQGLWK